MQFLAHLIWCLAGYVCLLRFLSPIASYHRRVNQHMPKTVVHVIMIWTKKTKTLPWFHGAFGSDLTSAACCDKERLAFSTTASPVSGLGESFRGSGFASWWFFVTKKRLQSFWLFVFFSLPVYTNLGSIGRSIYRTFWQHAWFVRMIRIPWACLIMLCQYNITIIM